MAIQHPLPHVSHNTYFIGIQSSTQNKSSSAKQHKNTAINRVKIIVQSNNSLTNNLTKNSDNPTNLWLEWLPILNYVGLYISQIHIKRRKEVGHVFVSVTVTDMSLWVYRVLAEKMSDKVVKPSLVTFPFT